MTDRLKWDLRYLDSAAQKATWSKDPSTSVGAVLVDDSGEFSQGYNGFPRNVRDHQDRYGSRDIKYRLTVHAEHNCILSAARRGNRVEGATLYVDGLMICPECAKAAVQSGVKRVVMRVYKENTRPEWVDAFHEWSTIILSEGRVAYTCYEHDGRDSRVLFDVQ